MDEQSKRCKTVRSGAKRLRNARVVELATEGKHVGEIAHELKIGRNTVTRILSSDEVKKILKEADTRVHGLVTKALDTVEQAIQGGEADMTNSLKAALALLKSAGVMKDNVNVAHTFPKPTIIKKRDGSEVILGTKLEGEE